MVQRCKFSIELKNFPPDLSGEPLLQIQVLKKISAFTVNLSYNLEPIYSIILAMLLFSEAKELNAAFYIGLGVIILSVILQTLSVIRSNKKI